MLVTVLNNERDYLLAYFEHRFAERRSALEEFYRLLHTAVESGDTKQLQASLAGILGIIQDNPLDDLVEFRERWSNPEFHNRALVREDIDMQVGFFTMPLHPPGSDITQTLEDDLHQIEVLDDLGYTEAWIGEHFTTVWENIPAPDIFIANRAGAHQEHQAGHRCDLYAQPQPVHDRAPHRPARPHGPWALPVGRRIRRVPG